MLALLLQPLRTRTVCASAIARETRLQDTTTDSQLSHTRVRPSAHARTHTRTHRPAKWRRYDVVPLPREVAAAVHRLGSIGCPPPSPLPLVSMRKGRSKRNSLPRPSKTSQRTQALRAISQALRAAPPDPLFTLSATSLFAISAPATRGTTRAVPRFLALPARTGERPPPTSSPVHTTPFAFLHVHVVHPSTWHAA